jgi:hypothetical protein
MLSAFAAADYPTNTREIETGDHWAKQRFYREKPDRCLDAAQRLQKRQRFGMPDRRASPHIPR